VTTADPWYLQAFAFLEVHKDGATTAILLLSATIALIAMVVGPAISLLIAKKQITSGFETQRQQTDTAIRVARLNFNAMVVSTNRQRWIDNLRDTLAEFLAFARSVASHLRARRFGTGLPDQVRRMLELSTKVELFLNPIEPDHVEFVNRLHELQSAAMSRDAASLPTEVLDADAERLDSLVSELTTRAKLILKAEWNRVKDGEPEQQAVKVS
jgi:hypothetical protein